MTTAQLDKSLDTAVSDGHGAISIRVVVVEKGLAAAAAPSTTDETPLDAAADEMLPETDKRPFSGFLEEPKRGKQCCVFLINEQRQHAWDNQFVVRDLDLKYLRNRMIVVVDCDTMKPEAVAEMMQGSRHQFFECAVYAKLEQRVIATLKGDPDLRRLEEEAEDEISNLEAGDEAVKAALDQLIEAHHDAAPRTNHGDTQAGDATRDNGVSGTLIQEQEVIIADEPNVGTVGAEPVLHLRPDVATVRLKPNELRKLVIYSNPDGSWQLLESMALTFDPPLKELQVTRTTQTNGEEVALRFAEPEDLDDDEYPIDTMMRSTAIFKGFGEPRILERRVVVNPPKQRPRPKPVPLKDDPTFILITSRQPIKILIGGPDIHVKMRWDGKDELINGVPPAWTIKVTCESPSVEPVNFRTRPVDGRFELLIQADPGLKGGEQIRFDVEAVGPGKTLATAFLADVIAPPPPRKVSAKTPGGGQRRPPYDLRYVKKENWGDQTCWGQNWTGEQPGAFEPPGAKSPLVIFINVDMDLLTSYRDILLGKRNAETTIQHQTTNTPLTLPSTFTRCTRRQRRPKMPRRTVPWRFRPSRRCVTKSSVLPTLS